MWRKIFITGGLLVVLGWLFWQSVQSSLSEPYVIDQSLVAEWRLVLRSPMQAGVGLLALQPTDQLRAELFQQIFGRTMESMTSPVAAAIPLILREEYAVLVARGMSPDDLRRVAEAVGVADTAPRPLCIGVVREAVRGGSRQLYYALFASPAVDEFRRQLVEQADDGGSTSGSFEASPYALAIPLAASDGDFQSWFPLRVTETDCLAPLQVR